MKCPVEDPVRRSDQPSHGNAEKRFLDMLKNIFIGVPIEGDSGFVNLMRIKATYFEEVMEDKLLKEINEAIKDFPDFRDELFDKLYSFFRRYFTESGSIGFFFTPYHQSVYEQVYTNEQDVVLFWKTARLYYVKTDRLFQSMTVEVDGFRFHFDVSKLEHKRANEKRELIYTFQKFQQDDKTQTPQDDKTKTQRNDKTETQRDDKTKKMTIVFTVHYSERGRQTQIDDIRCAIRKALGLSRYTDAVPSEETLQKAFRIFERQSEVDYFLCKDAKSFLREQFDLWMWQYLLGKPGEESHTIWTETRLAQLQALKHIAYRVIDYIAAFEDELVKIWNKPKFVLKSHYVITLDRIAAQPGGEAILERLWAHPNMERQLKEWRELGMVSENFTLEDLLLPPSAASNPQQNLFEVAKVRGLITNGYHLPYNPDLVERARELRRPMTPAEEKLWEYLKHAPYRFLRQRPIDHFIVDFYCPALRLVIEVDGEQHYTEEGKVYDAERDAILQGYGLRVVRFRNEEVLHYFESVCRRIEAALGSPLTPSLSGVGSPLSPLTKGGEGEGSGGIDPSLASGGEGEGRGQSPLTLSLSPLGKGGEGKGSGGIHPRYRYLPIDTRHFPDLELPIVALFDNLDEALDGWLIKSENYQALNTILPKFRDKVQIIYIDPPFNKEQDADYHYSVKYKDATWITLLENRVRLGREMLNEKGAIFVRCDYNGNMYVRLLMNEVFGDENFRNEIQVNRFQKSSNGFTNTTESLFLYSLTDKVKMNTMKKPRVCTYCKQPVTPRWTWAHSAGEGKDGRFFVVEGKRMFLYPPKGRHWTNSQQEIDRLQAEGRIRINHNASYIDIFGNRINFVPEKLQSGEIEIDNNWTDIPGYEFGVFSSWRFPTENSEVLLKRVIESTSDRGDLVMDFFLGSGTTVAVAHKLGRKWIGVEMGEHFYTIVLPRMKRVLFYDKSGISKEKDVQERYNPEKAGGFFKYYALEQFEDTLRRAQYAEADLFTESLREDPCQYLFLRDLKMLEALEVDWEKGKVRVDLSRLYEGIDIPETLSNLTGRWIRRIYPDPQNPKVVAAVEFEDGEKVDLRQLEWHLIKPLIWW
jgi:adenine specific DNA methylase Mod/very-short-patch-repair endonuclease